MNEPNNCPFCGEPADDRYKRLAWCNNEDCVMNMHVDYGEVFCSQKNWNNRPIEDVLTAHIAKLEDELPEDLSDEVYDAMFGCSKVDFVRLFPFVEVDGQKMFLVDLTEREE